MSSLLTAQVIKALSPGPDPGINLLITVGNDFRHDDGAGPYIFSKLKPTPALHLFNAGQHPESIVDRVTGLKPAKIIIIDAADFNGYPGQIRLIPEEAIPQTSMSTHMIPLSVVTELIKMDTAASIVFIGIQPKDTTYGKGLTSEMKIATRKLLSAIKKAYYA
jgi:hydrogenase 3 maturation protease